MAGVIPSRGLRFAQPYCWQNSQICEVIIAKSGRMRPGAQQGAPGRGSGSGRHDGAAAGGLRLLFVLLLFAQLQAIPHAENG
ncbi:hypothetical protein E05_35740 [Plautia stali symbiont]|nr:hypothetical protein E05_35740 [Plautia stali symbiont]